LTFNHAQRDGIIPTNPFTNLGLKQSRGRKDLTVLSPEELEHLGACAVATLGREYGPSFRAMILFAAYTGMRPGEVFALQWDDVRGDEVHVRRNLDRTGNLKLPKNGQARRIVLPPPAKAALTDVVRLEGQPWVFLTVRGKQFNNGNLAWVWGKVRAAAGRPGMDFYELRHFCATYLLERGLGAADVAVQLGHTDNGRLVMSTYGHPSEDAARRRILRAWEASADAA
jgi:integrase